MTKRVYNGNGPLKTVGFQLNAKDYAKLAKYAESCNLSAGQLVRKICLNSL